MCAVEQLHSLLTRDGADISAVLPLLSACVGQQGIQDLSPVADITGKHSDVNGDVVLGHDMHALQRHIPKTTVTPMLVTLSFSALEADAVQLTAPCGATRKPVVTSLPDDPTQRQNRPIIGSQSKED